MHLGRQRSHFKKVLIAFSLRRWRESFSSRLLCFGLREIEVFVTTNLKSNFLVEQGGQ